LLEAGLGGDDIILDPFGGSGTVTLVAQWLGRNSIYIDNNPEFLQQAIERNGFTGLCHADSFEIIDCRESLRESAGAKS
jgi:DNA modification methylase